MTMRSEWMHDERVAEGDVSFFGGCRFCGENLPGALPGRVRVASCFRARDVDQALEGGLSAPR